jgi:hypothetical protein
VEVAAGQEKEGKRNEVDDLYEMEEMMEVVDDMVVDVGRDGLFDYGH